MTTIFNSPDFQGPAEYDDSEHVTSNPLYDDVCATTDVPLKAMNKTRDCSQNSVSNPGYGRTLPLTVRDDANESAQNFGYEFCTAGHGDIDNPLYESTVQETGEENRKNPYHKQRDAVDLNPLYEISSPTADWQGMHQSSDDSSQSLDFDGSHIRPNPIYEGGHSSPSNAVNYQSTQLGIKANSAPEDEMDINPLYDQSTTMNPLYECGQAIPAQALNDEANEAVNTAPPQGTPPDCDGVYEVVVSGKQRLKSKLRSLSLTKDNSTYSILEKH